MGLVLSAYLSYPDVLIDRAARVVQIVMADIGNKLSVRRKLEASLGAVRRSDLVRSTALQRDIEQILPKSL